ncbi:MAG: hypothetical protein ACRDY2_01895 [Acidimicrobiales bacterium]
MNDCGMDGASTHVWRLIPSPGFREWRGSLDPNSRAEVDDALVYLRQFGRDAALPYVRHRIQSSRVGGYKTESGNAWYSDAIPAADELIDQFRNYRARRST